MGKSRTKQTLATVSAPAKDSQSLSTPNNLTPKKVDGREKKNPTNLFFCEKEAKMISSFLKIKAVKFQADYLEWKLDKFDFFGRTNSNESKKLLSFHFSAKEQACLNVITIDKKLDPLALLSNVKH